MKRSHLVLFAASLGLIAASIIMTAFLWNEIPTIVPTHFGFAGTPDAWSNKSLIMLFLLPLINVAIFFLFVLLYKYPQYSSWPTTLILMTVEEEKREKVFQVYREMMAWILFIISLMFAYIQYSILATANGRANGLLPVVMIAFIAVIFVAIIYVNIRMLLTVKRIVKSHR
jgi:uncharacterized membrane protein